MKFSVFMLLASAVLWTGCTTEKQLKEQIRQIIKEDPTLIIEAVESKPVAFMGALQKAARTAQSEMAKQRDDDEKKQLEERFATPFTPEIRSDENIRGSKDAPLVLVEYSDFECPYCGKAFETVEELMKKYGNKLQFVYKHLPLSFHPSAMLAAQYYEAIRLQSGEKAWAFHDALLKDQSKLRNGEKFLKSVAEKVGADMKKLAKDLQSEEVKNRIDADLKEAAKFGFQGTPGFLLNGIPVKGAYPASHFEGIVEELKKRGTVKL